MRSSPTITAILAAVLASNASAGPTTTVERDASGRWLIHREGTAIEMRGVCIWGTSPELAERLALLRDIGGNVVRTYDDEHAAWTLDQCRRLGLYAWLTFDLARPRHGFDYLDRRAVESQRQRFDQFVLAHRSDPAVIVWSIANEAELMVEEPAQREALFREMAHLIERAKALDPTRPVSVTLAGFDDRLRGEAIRWLGRVDVLGINMYAHVPNLTGLLDERSWDGPVAITEFGPIGHWEAARTAWGQPIEKTSEEKAEHYAQSWKAMQADARCVGGFAFYWGWKQEVTSTWFGMFLDDGSKLGSIEAMHRAWRPESPVWSFPTVSAPRSAEGVEFVADQLVRFEIQLSGRAEVSWLLAPESTVRGVGGDGEPSVEKSDSRIVVLSSSEAEVRMPSEAGEYRLFVVARDGQGHAATSNLPLRVIARP